MTAVIRFSRELGSWIVDGLEAKWPPATLILTLIEERLDAGIARSLVEAFASAHRSGRAFPAGTLIVDGTTLGTEHEVWHGSEARAAWSVALDVARDGTARNEG